MKLKLTIIFLAAVFTIQHLWSQNKSAETNLTQKINSHYSLPLVISKQDSSNENTDIYSKTEECDIFLKNRTSYKDVNILSLRGGTLEIDKKGIKRNIGVNQINKIKFSGPSGFWTGALIGAGISTAGWLIAGIASGGGAMPYVIGYAAATLLPTGLLGGLIGLITAPDDEVYDIAGGNPKARLKRLRYLIHEHTPKPF